MNVLIRNKFTYMKCASIYLIFFSSLLYSANDNDPVTEGIKGIVTDKRFIITKLLGVGIFSDVYSGHKVKKAKEWPETFAVKVYPEGKKGIDYYYTNQKMQDRTACAFNREVESLKKLKDCPLVVDMFYAEFSKKSTKLPYIILELGDISLLDAIIKMKEKGMHLTDGNANFIARDLESATRYMHEARIENKDLKMKNVLYFMNKEQLKICDFNASVRLEVPSYASNSTMERAANIVLKSKELIDHNCIGSECDCLAMRRYFGYEKGDIDTIFPDNHDLKSLLHVMKSSHDKLPEQKEPLAPITPLPVNLLE